MIQSSYATGLILAAGIYVIIVGAQFIHDHARNIALNNHSILSSAASLMMFMMLLIFVLGPFIHFSIVYSPIFLPKLQLLLPKAMLERNFLNLIFAFVMFYFIFQSIKGFWKGRRLKRHEPSFVKDYHSF